MKRVVVAAALLLAACSSDSGPSKTPHALIIGLDGVRPDALQGASTPRLDGLIASGTVSYDGFAGGVLGEESEQPTFSGPGWSSILTGVWTDKHAVKLNVFDDANFAEYPHFFAHIREKKHDVDLSSFVTWAPINQSILASAEGDAVFTWDDPNDSAGGDLAVTTAAGEIVSPGPEHAAVPPAVIKHLGLLDRSNLGLRESALRALNGPQRAGLLRADSPCVPTRCSMRSRSLPVHAFEPSAHAVSPLPLFARAMHARK